MATKQEQEKDNKILRLEKELDRLKKNLKKQKYGLVWMDVPEAFEDDVENKLPILKENQKLAIKNNDGKPTHILIEGDNYHALTCLNYTHKGKVDVIYIDPPYNTGSDGFRYKDKRILDKFPDGTEVPKDHPYRHSYWLSFMRKRLELAGNLLRDDGVIFISIDDNEAPQLKLLCDEVFGESNFLIPLYVQVRYPGKTLVEDMDFQKIIETVYVYGKSAKSKLNKEKIDYSFDKFVWQVKELSKPKIVELGGKKVEIFRKDQYEIIKVEASREGLKEIWATGKVLDGNSSGRFFRDFIVGREKDDGLGTLYKVSGIGDDSLDHRYFTGPKREGATKGKYFQGVPMDIIKSEKIKQKFLPITNFVNFADSFGNCRSEGDVDFRSGKKPLAFLKYILKLGIKENKNNIILDFFAGSGSTGHAVLDLNNELEIENQFILNTNNENNIMSSICYPRIKNAIKGYKNKSGLGGSIHYYQTAFVGENNILDATDKDKIELAHNAGELLAIAENTFELVKQDKYMQIFENDDQYTAVYFREEMDKLGEFATEVKKLKKDVSVYIFSWEDEAMFDEFEGLNNIRLKTIPQPIVEIYKQIYNLI